MKSPETLVDLVRAQAERLTDRIAFTWTENDQEVGHLTYRELDERARQIAGALQRLGAAGERVLLILPPGLDYIAAFLGCLFAGAIAVPCYPPGPLGSGRARRRLQAVIADARPRVVLHAPGLLPAADQAAPASQEWIALDVSAADPVAPWQPPVLTPDALAFIQYTSGSTGSPKGVMLTHRNLLHNSALIHQAFAQDESSVVVSWLPPYHDMGLIGGILQPLYSGARCVLLSPLGFLKRPRSWLAAISRYRGTTSGGPNFGYEHCLRKVPAPEREGLRLDHWKVAFSGAEPVRSETLARFAEAFGGAGFRASAFLPCYGLAEATLAVAAASPQAPPTVRSFDRDSLGRGFARPGPAESVATGRTLVGCGRPLGEQELAIVEPATGTPLPPEQIGEIWVRGASVAGGYFENPEATRAVFGATTAGGHGPYLRTGDLGFLDAGGELFVVGRHKDLIIANGVNHHPHDLEHSLEQAHGNLRPGGCAAFAVDDGEGEQLVIVAEVTAAGASGSDPLSLERLAQSIRMTVLEEHDLAPATVVLVPPGTIAKTTSGKTARHACREAFLAGGHPVLFRLEAAPPSRPDRASPAPGAELAAVAGVMAPLEALWCDVLGVASAAPDDDFFALGGHSLLAAELVARLASELGLQLSLRELAAAPTLRDLQERLAEGTRVPRPAPRALHAAPERRGEPFPLTDIQQAYLFGRNPAFELGNVASQAYFELERQSLDLERLARAIDRVVARHDMLRAIVRADGQQQVLASVPPFPLAVTDLRGVPDAEAQLRQIRETMSTALFTPDRWPLFAIHVVRLTEERVRLFFGIDLLVADLFSIKVFWRDLERAYREPAAALTAPSLSFQDVVAAELERAGSATELTDLSYWRQRLATVPPAPELPLARSPRSVERPRFTRRTVELDAEAWGRFRRNAGQGRVTPSAALLTAFAHALATWSRHPRFTLNLTLFNRPPIHPEISELIGDFTSLALVPVELEGAAFAHEARRIQQELFAALEHRSVSGVRVLRELAALRGDSLRAWMPVVFTSALVDDDDDALSSPWLGRVASSGSSTPQVMLDHQVMQVGGRLVLTWDSVEELFPPGLLDEMFAAYVGLIRRLARPGADWGSPVDSLVPTAHRRRLASPELAPTGPVPSGTLHGLFLRQAREQPHAPAVMSSRGSLSYDEVEVLSRGLAIQLRDRGAGPGQVVAVAMTKGWEQVVGTLGVLRAGAAYVPIDPGLPAERRRLLLAQCRVRYVVIQPEQAASLDLPEGITAITVERGREPEPAAGSFEEPADASALAYVIFTSGSTGTPKGVMIDHRGAINTIVDVNTRFGVGPGDRILGLSALSFDLSVWDVFGALAAGATLVLPDPGTNRDPAHWEQLIEHSQVTVWNSVPALMEMLAEHCGRGRGPALGSLRLVMLSGDWIPVSLPDQIRALAPRAKVVSLGGATEASIWSILHEIDRVDPDWPSIPYGRAMLNQTVQVLDHRLAPCPVWKTGDLYIGGVGLALGYLGDEEKTRASFLTHPRSGHRLYRTGDLGRTLPSGDIEFLGRVDGQVKIQGHRIELGEIEAHLAAHPRVRQCVALARTPPGTTSPDRAAATRRALIAYVVISAGDAVPEAELRSWLQERLPASMIPARVVPLEGLPLGPNGKVDVASLPWPAEPSRRSHQPRSPGETQVLAAWSEALLIPAQEIDPDANFFEAGGNSISAVRVARILSDATGQPVSPMDLFAHPTVEAMARWLKQVHKPEDGEELDGRAAVRRRNISRLRDRATAARPSDGEE